MPYSAVVMGVSAGGMKALSTILPALPSEFRLPVIVVQHMAADAPGYLTEFLNQKAAVRVEEAADKQPIRPGTVSLAPPGYHLLIEADRSFSLSVDPPVNYSRPSIDVLFESAADAYGDELVGVVLTGASSDGAAGLRRIKERGGLAVVQDPAGAEASCMPEAALAAAEVDRVLRVEEVGPFLVRLAGSTDRRPIERDGRAES